MQVAQTPDMQHQHREDLSVDAVDMKTDGLAIPTATSTMEPISITEASQSQPSSMQWFILIFM